MTSDVLIANFAGLGDGLIELPFLKNMEISSPQVRFFHTGGTMFGDRELMRVLALRSCGGIVPAIWRKFLPEHWADIEALARDQGIRRIVNLRNLGPEFDTGYFNFKQRYGDRFEFFDYSFDSLGFEGRNIRVAIDGLLRHAGLVRGEVNAHALRKQVLGARPHGSLQGIGINIHAGSPFKWWPYSKWKELCLGLVNTHPLKVFAGHGDKEGELASRLVEELESYRRGWTQLIFGSGIFSILQEIAAMKGVVSADSWIPHAASGLGTPSTGLYIVTTARTWGAGYGSSTFLESPYLRKCDRFSEPLGVCLDQYTGCGMVRQFGDGIEVSDALALVLGTIRQ